MNTEDSYMKLPYDLSGSSSKNRFRLEILWGASKMFDLYDTDDFCIVFDYKCDIEVHFKDSLEFYQIKTHKVQSPYTFTTLSKKDKTGKSILGKLFLLKNTSDKTVPIKVALVSNAFFRLGSKTYSDVEELNFNNLDEKSQKKILDALKDEIGNDFKLSNVHYIYTSMNLNDPENDLRGKIVGCFEKIKNCEPTKPNALYRLIRETVEQKACYEFASDSYAEVIEKKGITKSQLDNMLDRYVSRIDNAVEKISNYIDKTYTKPKERKELKQALINIVEGLFSSKELKRKEYEVADFLLHNSDDLPDSTEDVVDYLILKFGQTFTVENSEKEIYVLMLLILYRWEDGKYEQNDI